MSKLIKTYSNLFTPEFCKETRGLITRDSWTFSKENNQSDWQKLIVDELNNTIIDFLSFSRESHVGQYSLHSLNIISEKDVDQKLRKNDELKTIDGDKFFRNFKILLYLNEENSDELFFPLQEESLKASGGSVVIFPTSYMYPYKIMTTGTLKIQLNYAFRTEIVLNPVKHDLGIK